MFTYQHVFLFFVFITSVLGQDASPARRSGRNNPRLFASTLAEASFLNITYPFSLVLNSTGTDPGMGGICQNQMCYSVIGYTAPGYGQILDVIKKGGYIFANYNICSSVTYSPMGAPQCMGFQDNLTMTLDQSALRATLGMGANGAVVVKPYQIRHTISPSYFLIYYSNTAPFAHLPTVYSSGTVYRGVNLAGAEFDTPAGQSIPGDMPGASEMIYFVDKGMNTARIPFRWEYLQPNLNQPINFSTGYGLQLVNLITALVNANVYVVLDMHNYMRYNGSVIGSPGSAATTANYATAWGQLANQFHGAAPNFDNYVFFDLMNEPHDMDTNLILTNYNAAIAAIRATGAANLILLEGNCYSCLGAWFNTASSYSNCGTVPNSTAFVPANIIDSSNNWAISPHQYLDAQPCGSGETNCVPASQVLSINNFSGFMNYVQANNLKVFLGEINGIANENCYGCIRAVLSAVEENAYTLAKGYGFIGWAVWAPGHAWPYDPPENYPLNIAWTGVDSGQMTNAFQYYLTEP